MKWYLSKIVFQIICGNGKHQPQFDEQFRLITGTDAEDACAKARQIGEQEHEVFLNRNNEPMEWKFIGVADIFPLRELRDGIEVISRIHEPEDAEAYIVSLNKKSLRLLSQPS